MNSRFPPFDLPPILPSRNRTGAPSIPARPRTPSSLNFPALGFATSSVAGLPPLSAASSSTLPYDRHGALSVPPPSSNSNITSADYLTPRMIACLPCKRSHLKCGRGMRPCNQCIKKGRIEECLEGVPPDQARMFLKAYYEREGTSMQLPPSLGSRPVTPVFDDAPLFPLNSSIPPRSSAGYPSLGQASQAISYPPLGQLDDDPTQTPVMLVLGQDLRVGRASQAALRTLGYHPHELVNQALSYYLPVSEREKWKNFTGKLFTPMTPAGGALPVSVVELARLSMNDITAPVEGMRSIVGHYHLRHHNKKFIPVRIELWFGSYFGATVANFNTFTKAVIVAKISEIQTSTSPSSSSAAASASRSPPTFSRFGDGSVFPSVLMPAPTPSSGSGESLPLPRRRRTPSLPGDNTGSNPLLAPLPTLPSISSAFGGRFPPLPADFKLGSRLPPLGSLAPLPPLSGSMDTASTPTRKRRPSSSGAQYPDSGGGLPLPLPYPSSGLARPPPLRPRLGSLSQHPGSLDPGKSFSGSSLDFPSSFDGGLPPLTRPPSRNRRPSQF